MEVRKRSDANEEAGSEPSPDSSRIFGTMIDAGSGCYLRARDLPRMIPARLVVVGQADDIAASEILAVFSSPLAGAMRVCGGDKAQVDEAINVLLPFRDEYSLPRVGRD